MRADLTVYFEPRNMFLRMDKVTEAYKVLIVAHDWSWQFKLLFLCLSYKQI